MIDVNERIIRRLEAYLPEARHLSANLPGCIRSRRMVKCIKRAEMELEVLKDELLKDKG